MNVYLKNYSLEMEPLIDEERIGAARDPLTTPEQLNKLSMDDDSCVRYYVAGNPVTPIEAITRLAHDDDEDVSELAISSAVIQPGTLSELSTHTNVVQRVAVARHTLTPTIVLNSLSTDADRHVRVGIAGNPKVSQALLIQLLERTNHDDIRVLAAAAANRALPSRMLIQIVSDDRPLIRMSAASNPLLKPEQMNELLFDSDEYVRKALMRNPALPDSLSMCCVDDLL